MLCPGLFLCPPSCCRSWRWIGAKLQTGRGWVWRIYISNRTDVCFLFSQASAHMLYFWAVVNFKGKTEVTGGCQLYAISGHHGISGYSWFKTNAGNVWRRCFLHQVHFNISGKVFSCRTTCSTLYNSAGTNPSFSWGSGFRLRWSLSQESISSFLCQFFFLSCSHETGKGLMAISIGKCLHFAVKKLFFVINPCCYEYLKVPFIIVPGTMSAAVSNVLYIFHSLRLWKGCWIQSLSAG